MGAVGWAVWGCTDSCNRLRVGAARTSRENGSRRSSRSVDFWYARISRSARTPGRTRFGAARPPPSLLLRASGRATTSRRRAASLLRGMVVGVTRPADCGSGVSVEMSSGLQLVASTRCPVGWHSPAGGVGSGLARRRQRLAPGFGASAAPAPALLLSSALLLLPGCCLALYRSAPSSLLLPSPRLLPPSLAATSRSSACCSVCSHPPPPPCSSLCCLSTPRLPAHGRQWNFRTTQWRTLRVRRQPTTNVYNAMTVLFVAEMVRIIASCLVVSLPAVVGGSLSAPTGGFRTRLRVTHMRYTVPTTGLHNSGMHASVVRGVARQGCGEGTEIVDGKWAEKIGKIEAGKVLRCFSPPPVCLLWRLFAT